MAGIWRISPSISSTRSPSRMPALIIVWYSDAVNNLLRGSAIGASPGYILLLQHRLGDLDRVEGAATGQIIHHRPQPETARGLVLAHGAEEHLVAGGGVDRPQVARLVGGLEGGICGEGLADRLQAERLRAAHVEAGGDGMEDGALEDLERRRRRAGQ